MLIQCTPLLVEKAGEAPEMVQGMQARKSAGERTTQTAQATNDSKIGAISGPKLTLVQQNNLTVSSSLIYFVL